MALASKPHVWPDILLSAQWYESQRPGLGGEFVTEVQHYFGLLADNPRIFPVILRRKGRQVRRALLKRFPFGIYFVAAENEILVIAVLHLQRRPGEWKKHAH